MQRAMRKGKVFQHNLSTKTNMETEHQFPQAAMWKNIDTSCVSRMGQLRLTDSVSVISILKISSHICFCCIQY